MLLQDVENIVALPNEAAEAEEMLKDDSQLLQVLLLLTPPSAAIVHLIAILHPPGSIGTEVYLCQQQT